jgi:hypothetical protein
MRNPICSAFWWRPLLSTALPFGLLVAGAISAQAGSVTVTGANGANGTNASHGGGTGASASAVTTTPTELSNTADATGGAGGQGQCYITSCSPPAYPGAGGAGGGATSQATTSIATGSAAAAATSSGGTGGAGGNGAGFVAPAKGGGAGGSANSAAIASSEAGSATATATSSGGKGGGGGRGPANEEGGVGGAGGNADATAHASSQGSALVQATATSTGGAGGNGGKNGGEGWAPAGGDGSAYAISGAQNSSGAATALAFAPAGAPAGASSVATAGSSAAAALPSIAAGHVVSDATLTSPTGDIGVGAMSAAYGGSGSALTYEATATFDFSTSKKEALDLNLLSNNPAQIGFDSLDLQVINETTSKSLASLSFTSSSAAETFFKKGQVSLGSVGAGSQSIEIEYMLGYNSGTSAAAGDGFAFTYALVDPPVGAAVPETSTWAMMLVGFAGLAFAGYRARVTPASAPSDRAGPDDESAGCSLGEECAFDRRER